MQGSKQPQFNIGRKSLQQLNDKIWKSLINLCEFKLENWMFVKEDLFLNKLKISYSDLFVIFLKMGIPLMFFSNILSFSFMQVVNEIVAFIF